jgi:hypothetical protein
VAKRKASRSGNPAKSKTTGAGFKWPDTHIHEMVVTERGGDYSISRCTRSTCTVIKTNDEQEYEE